MKKHKSIITAVAFILVLAAFVVAMFVDKLGPIITSVTSTIITVVGALVIWIQFKRDGELAAIDVVSQLNKLFLKSDGLMCLREKLIKTCDPADYSEQGMLKGQDITRLPNSYITDDNLNLIEYLEFFENIAVMVFDDVLKIKSIDSVFGDSFFYALNNTYIQNNEIIPYVEHYTHIVVLHREWTNYRLKNGIEIPYYSTSLSNNLEKYNEIKV